MKQYSIPADTILFHFYPEDTPLRRLLLAHSVQVREKALAIFRTASIPVNPQIVSAGAMLHDIGILKCHAPDILCVGAEPYLAHGILGAAMLREYGAEHDLDLEVYARICERHTGAGITAREIREHHLPIPENEYLPVTNEEKLICLADKFFSKSGDLKEKSIEKIRRSMKKFGPDPAERFDGLLRLFNLDEKGAAL